MTEGKERTVMEIAMKIDLHIHAKTSSDGNLSVEEVFQESKEEKYQFDVNNRPRFYRLSRKGNRSG